MPKAEKLQAIHAVVISVMMFLLKKQQELASLFVSYVEVPYVCDFLRSECDVTM